MEAVEQVLANGNTWLICILTGALIWGVRQVTPGSLEGKPWWKKLMRVAPLFVGGLLALIPDFRPVPDSMPHSVAVGFISGSFAQSAYDLIRDNVPEKLKAILGSRAKRRDTEV